MMFMRIALMSSLLVSAGAFAQPPRAPEYNPIFLSAHGERNVARQSHRWGGSCKRFRFDTWLVSRLHLGRVVALTARYSIARGGRCCEAAQTFSNLSAAVAVEPENRRRVEGAK